MQDQPQQLSVQVSSLCMYCIRSSQYDADKQPLSPPKEGIQVLLQPCLEMGQSCWASLAPATLQLMATAAPAGVCLHCWQLGQFCWAGRHLRHHSHCHSPTGLLAPSALLFFELVPAAAAAAARCSQCHWMPCCKQLRCSVLQRHCCLAAVQLHCSWHPQLQLHA